MHYHAVPQLEIWFLKSVFPPFLIQTSKITKGFLRTSSEKTLLTSVIITSTSTHKCLQYKY